MSEVARQYAKRTPDEEIAEALESDIIFGRITPGERLREEALLDRYGYSRHFIRLAFARLEKKGIIVHTRNIGAAVRAFTIPEVEEIYDVREMIQRQAILRIKLPAPSEDIAYITAIQREYAACVKAGDLQGIQACNDRFHLAIFALCNNGHLLALVKQYMDLTYVIRSVSFSDPNVLETSRKQHELMIEQLKGRDSWALAELCVQHLRPNKENYLDRLRKMSSANVEEPDPRKI
jgi:DNA-binding GntR family transcriptional regulator